MIVGDSTYRIATITYINPDNGDFVALGHEFSDLSSLSQNPALPVTHASDISKGDAVILSDVDGSGIKEYKKLNYVNTHLYWILVSINY